MKTLQNNFTKVSNSEQNLIRKKWSKISNGENKIDQLRTSKGKTVQKNVWAWLHLGLYIIFNINNPQHLLIKVNIY